MTKSIIQKTKECIVCHRPPLEGKPLHRHHIYFGKNKDKSEKFGCVCFLCGYHHNLSNEGVHFNKELDDELKDYCQRIFELEHSRIEFMYHFGKDYTQDKYNEGGYKWINR